MIGCVRSYDCFDKFLKLIMKLVPMIEFFHFRFKRNVRGLNSPYIKRDLFRWTILAFSRVVI